MSGDYQEPAHNGRREFVRFYDMATTNQRYGKVQAINPRQSLFQVKMGNGHWTEVPTMEAMFWNKLGYKVWSDGLNAQCNFSLGGKPYRA